ncbi:MAG: alpha/beta fold hydrolase [Sandaracinaceae bacterium]|nr:alpha/beta fold hydrolase [Sandaracinaceae bacterium]
MIVETCVGSLFVEVAGEGSPLVLWPSMLTDGGMWRFQIPKLRERFRTIVIDPPGHGRSAPVRRPYTLEGCADAAVEVLDALDVEEPVDWAGLSWGGMTGMRVALQSPARLRRLAILDSSAAREARRKLPSYHAMAFIARRVGALAILEDRIERIFFTGRSVTSRRDIVDPFREHLARMDPASIGHAVDAVIFHRVDLRPRLREITAPTLVMVGREDGATPPARSREIADGIRGARLVEIPDAAHLSALEQPDLVTRELLAHFA